MSSSASELTRQIEQARQAAVDLRSSGVTDVLDRLDRIVSRWLDPQFEFRQIAEERLPQTTTFSPEMIRHGLPTHFEPLRAPHIANLLRSELGDDLGSNHHQAVIAHILPGNIPGLAAAPMLLSLALRCPIVVKVASKETLFPALLAQSIEALDPELGRCIVVAHWRGGQEAFERVLFDAADVVVASGSDASLRVIAPQVRGRFIGHGHKISFAAIGREALANASALAERLAYDVTLWDQQGCLSPQVCFIEHDSAVSPESFGQLLASALQRWATVLPPRRLTLDERAAVGRFRQEAEWGTGSKMIASEATIDWSIALETSARLEPTCLNRCLRLIAIDGLDALPQILAPHRLHLEACGLASSDAREDDLSALLRQNGVHRVGRIGAMQLPTLEWRQGGRPRVREWVEP